MWKRSENQTAAENQAVSQIQATMERQDQARRDEYERRLVFEQARMMRPNPLYHAQMVRDPGRITTTTHIDPAYVPKVPPRPEAAVLTAEIEPSMEREYVELSRRLGFRHGETVMAREILRSWLAREEIPVYDYDQVSEYLDALCQTTMHENGIRYGVNGMIHAVWTPLQSMAATMPIEMLRLADKINAGAPVAKTFYVSQIESLPDPFLAVLAEEVTLIEGIPLQRVSQWPTTTRPFVVGHWDEPGFTLTKK